MKANWVNSRSKEKYDFLIDDKITNSCDNSVSIKGIALLILPFI